MKSSIIKLVAVAAMLSLAACAGTKFGGSDSSSSSKTTGAGGIDQLATGTDPNAVDDNGDDLLAQPTVPEFLDLINPVNGNPVVAAQVREADRCCMSHGQGHGIEVCVTGDKTGIAALSPVKIDGDQICITEESIVANAALFAAGVMGRCGQ